MQFTYPVMVMLIMIVFYHERFSWITALSILLAIAGVYLLCGGSDGDMGGASLLAVALLLLSALCNAVYITTIYAARIPNMSGLVMTFYVLAFGAVISGANALLSDSFQPLHSWWELLLATLLAVVTAVISNLTLILAVQRIGLHADIHPWRYGACHRRGGGYSGIQRAVQHVAGRRGGLYCRIGCTGHARQADNGLFSAPQTRIKSAANYVCRAFYFFLLPERYSSAGSYPKARANNSV